MAKTSATDLGLLKSRRVGTETPFEKRETLIHILYSQANKKHNATKPKKQGNLCPPTSIQEALL
jgi:hypothetical protein